MVKPKARTPKSYLAAAQRIRKRKAAMGRNICLFDPIFPKGSSVEDFCVVTWQHCEGSMEEPNLGEPYARCGSCTR